MATESHPSRFSAWFTFIGVMLLLLGAYASVRTVINLVTTEKYPQSGVIAINFTGQPPYYQREADCFYPQMYYQQDGKTTRPATPDEKENEKLQQKLCLEGIAENRENTKTNDISQSLLFLFMGAGIIISRRFFFK